MEQDHARPRQEIFLVLDTERSRLVAEDKMQTGSFINGKWLHPRSERLVRNINPADSDDVIAEFPAASTEDVLRAIEAAQTAFKVGKKLPDPSAVVFFGAPPILRASAPTRSPVPSPAKKGKSSKRRRVRF